MKSGITDTKKNNKKMLEKRVKRRGTEEQLEQQFQLKPSNTPKENTK